MTDANDFLYNNDATQKEKMELLRNERRLRDTMFNRAQTSLDDEAGGRYAKQNPTSVVGASPAAQYPQQPASSWSHDPVPKEEPLGFSVNAQEPTGSRAEQIEAEKLLDARGAAGSQPSAAPSPIKRRV